MLSIPMPMQYVPQRLVHAVSNGVVLEEGTDRAIAFILFKVMRPFHFANYVVPREEYRQRGAILLPPCGRQYSVVPDNPQHRIPHPLPGRALP